jgi:hypothetical protein
MYSSDVVSGPDGLILAFVSFSIESNNLQSIEHMDDPMTQ